MKSTLEEPRAERAPSGCAAMCGTCATCLGKEVKDAARRVEKTVTDAKAAVSETVEDARRVLKRSRYAVEDGIEEAAHTIKQHPFRTLAIGFAAGAALGLLAPRFGRR